MTIKAILDTLKEDERRALFFALEQDLTHYVLLPEGRFIGVNTENVAFLEADPSISRGNWSVGWTRSVSSILPQS